MTRLKTIIISFCACCGFAATMTSCLKDDDDKFTEPASSRLQTTMDQVTQILRDAPYGWELEYYGSEGYGGLIYTVRFDSLTATIGCSLVPDSTDVCFYRMTNDSGPVLTFDTYSPLLHYMATPSSNEYEAKGGDFEFVINQLNDSLITLSGKKSRRGMYLRRLHASADGYAHQAVDVLDNLPAGFQGTVNGHEVNATFAMKNKSAIIKVDDTSHTIKFTVNNRGIRFYQPVPIEDGLSLQSLDYNQSDTTFICRDTGMEGISLQGKSYSSDVVRFIDYEGSYTLRYNGTSTTARVQLVPNRLDGTYRLRGLSTKYELVLQYDYATGYLTLTPQTIGAIDGNTVYFLTYNNSTGSLWLTENASFTLKWNRNKIYVGYNFSATNPTRYDCNSGILVMLNVDADGTATAALVTDGAWLTNGSAMFPNLNSLMKLRN